MNQTTASLIHNRAVTNNLFFGAVTLNNFKQSRMIANYHPDDNLILKIGAPNIVMGAAETLYPTVEADGSFTIHTPLYHHSQVREFWYILLY